MCTNQPFVFLLHIYNTSCSGTPADPSADSNGNINIIAEAVRRGVKKFVLVTSIGTGDSRDAPPEKVYQVLEPVLLEKEKAEAYLKVYLQYKCSTVMIVSSCNICTHRSSRVVWSGSSCGPEV